MGAAEKRQSGNVSERVKVGQRENIINKIQEYKRRENFI